MRPTEYLPVGEPNPIEGSYVTSKPRGVREEQPTHGSGDAGSIAVGVGEKDGKPAGAKKKKKKEKEKTSNKVRCVVCRPRHATRPPTARRTLPNSRAPCAPRSLFY